MDMQHLIRRSLGQPSSPFLIASVLAGEEVAFDAAAIRRLRAEPVALCIQEGTVLDLATRHGCEDLGVTGSSQTGAETFGFDGCCIPD